MAKAKRKVVFPINKLDTLLLERVFNVVFVGLEHFEQIGLGRRGVEPGLFGDLDSISQALFVGGGLKRSGQLL